MARTVFEEPYDVPKYNQINSVFFNYPNNKNLAIKSSSQKREIVSQPFNLSDKVTNKVKVDPARSNYERKAINEFNGLNSQMHRTVFVRKVFFTILVQLIIMLGFQFLQRFNENVRECCNDKTNYCVWVPLFSTTLTLILTACGDYHRKYPYNYLALAYFTCSAGVFLMFVAIKFEFIYYSVIFAATLVCVLFIFTCQTKIHYSIYIGMCTVLVTDAFSIIFYVLTKKQEWTNFAYGAILATVFLFLFIIDLQIMITKNHSYHYARNEYIFATMTLYSDIINLFVYILQLLNSAKD